MIKTAENKDSDYILDAFGEILDGVKNPKQENKWYMTKVW